jgi:hypothetical protein
MARGIPMGAKAPPKMMEEEDDMMEGEGEESAELEGPEASIIMIGKKMDDAEEEGYSMSGPDVSGATVGGLNALVDGINAVLPMFEMPDYERFTDGVTTLPGKFVKLLTMVNSAAQAAGLDDMVVDIASISDDRSLKMAAGKLRALGGNTSFKRFLRSERPAPAAKEPMAPAPGGAPAPMASGPSEDELMMSRLA